MLVKGFSLSSWTVKREEIKLAKNRGYKWFGHYTHPLLFEQVCHQTASFCKSFFIIGSQNSPDIVKYGFG